MKDKYLMLLMLGLGLSGSIDAADIRHRPSVRLEGHVPTNAVSKSVLIEHVEPNATIPLTFTLPLRNQEELDALLHRIYDPSSADYQHYLTPDQFHARFSPTEDDYNKVVDYAKSLGLTVTNTHANRLLVNASGSARTVERAFAVRLHRYQHPSGRVFHAPNNNPQLPTDVASVIGGLVGLSNHSVWRPYNRRHDGHIEVEHVDGHTSPSGPNNGYAPSDLVKAYNLSGVAANGTGQSIALFELASYQVSDIAAYTTHFGLPAAQLKNVMVDGGSGQPIDPEVTLDIELALALSPHSVIYVYEGPNSNQGVLDTYNKIATDNLCKQVSTSWGMGEDNESSTYLKAESAIFQQMAAHGQTIYAAAGDSGAYDDSNNGSQTLVVDDPASQPYVCGVGGTKLAVVKSTGAYSSEAVWNEGAGNGAGGGGVSTVWAIPSYQTGVTTLYSKTHRNVPDVCLNADPSSGYAIFFQGAWTIYGGTSCAAPLWASFTACVNQQLEAANQPPLGFVNPTLYAIAGGSSYGSNFNDVTQGNNLFYQAGKGYDNASGWGSFNGGNLFATLTKSAPAPTPPAPTPPAPTPPAPTPPAPTPPAPQSYPDLFLQVLPTAPFVKGGNGTYAITVDNIGSGATSGAITVTLMLSPGQTIESVSGTGWTVNSTTHTCTRSDALAGTSSYPPINVSVSLDANAPSDVIIAASVSGGGSAPNTIEAETSVH